MTYTWSTGIFLGIVLNEWILAVEMLLGPRFSAPGVRDPPEARKPEAEGGLFGPAHTHHPSLQGRS